MKKSKSVENEVKQMNVTVTENERVMKDNSTLVSVTDLKGRVLYANKDFLEIAGLTEEELVGKPHNVVRHPDMPRSAFQDFWDTIQSGKPWNGLVKNRSKNGDYYWVDANVAPRVENGSITGFMSVRRKPSRDQVSAASELYRKILAGKASLPRTDVSKVSIRTKMWIKMIATALMTSGIAVMALFKVDANY
ncbi:MAG: PAS domain-containing protein, partial [Leptospira sp.]|nr:PAS domain-containing protein [Leptospira sp.]